VLLLKYLAIAGPTVTGRMQFRNILPTNTLAKTHWNEVIEKCAMTV
jgi:hypothetical protein